MIWKEIKRYNSVPSAFPPKYPPPVYEGPIQRRIQTMTGKLLQAATSLSIPYILGEISRVREGRLIVSNDLICILRKYENIRIMSILMPKESFACNRAPGFVRQNLLRIREEKIISCKISRMFR